jgi:hypothetical protein
MGKGIAFAAERAEREEVGVGVGIEPGVAGSVAARARNIAGVLLERSGTFTLPPNAMP